MKLNMLTAQTAKRTDWVYNALDTLATRDIYDTISSRMDPVFNRSYGMERATQGPAVTMSLRGILIDPIELQKATTELSREVTAVARKIGKMTAITSVWDALEKNTGPCASPTRKDGKHGWEPKVPDGPDRKCLACGAARMKPSPFNPGSPDQVKHLLYDLIGVKRQMSQAGTVTVDDESLSRIGRKWPKTLEITTAVQAYRGLKKQLGFLKFRQSSNGRFMSSFNIGTAWTGRWSSSSNNFGEGGNAQNITERHRHVFVPDPGYEMVYADLKQAESNMVAHISGDEEYIAAHKSGDVHTYVTRLVWPNLGWTWDLKKDKAIAKQLPEWDNVAGHDFRFQSKRIQHGSNYGLSPYGIAMIAHIPVEAAQQAQSAYFKAFPGIRAWQRTVREKVTNQEFLVNPLGVKFRLFGRPWDEHTYKQGLAVLPQSAVAHIINLAIWQVWAEMDPHELKLLAQVHDAILAQVPIGHREAVHKMLDLMRVAVPVTDIYGVTRTAVIETEAAVGMNWGHKNADATKGRINHDGLVEI